jgi:hypothetical protein
MLTRIKAGVLAPPVGKRQNENKEKGEREKERERGERGRD